LRRAILATVRLPAGYTLVNGALEREFAFTDFGEALAFVNRVGELAESENHHPDVAIHWNKVTLRWWTHVADAVTARDYELAARANELL
jgi:4a-hydroxytetrahydrobiopterin dehydratase